ncbi:SDR family NAD(P)-dependent oxidoreductase [Mycobacterium sp. AMU20-3851]|uniref:SDR family NAD(P)-dependent oxidoreductase n=1 Tax=Mycobacterium sp. AMU20-3851 TaxID=3122055 RepID=UPI003754DED6
MRLQGKRTFITGAASGIGAATKSLFEAEGAQVVGVDITAADDLLTCDVSDADSVRAAVNEAVARLGGLDVVVNVAGVGGMAAFGDMSLETWDGILGVNVTGPMLITQAALPHLRQSKGNVVSVASISGLQGQPYMSAYCASKAALLQLMKSLAVELAPDHIRVNSVCPGGVGQLPDMAGAERMVPPGVDPMVFTRLNPVLPGVIEPKDIADALAYLASDAARSITGATLTVDRGTLW